MPVRLLVAAAVLLAGCSSSSSTEERDFTQVSDAFDALNTRIEALPDATILPAGTATYRGLARLDVLGGSGNVLVGDAELNADFANATVSGAMSRFVDSQAGAVGGAIAMTGGTISGARIEGLAVAGDLAVGDRTLAFRGTGRGKFTGQEGSAAIVQMGGTAAGPNQPDWTGGAYLER